MKTNFYGLYSIQIYLNHTDQTDLFDPERSTLSGKSGPGSDSNEGVLHKHPRTGTSPPNAGLYHTQNTPLGGVLLPANDVVGVF